MARKRETDRVLTFRIPAELIDGLQQLFERDGISQSEAIRRAVRMFLGEKGISAGQKTTRGERAKRK